MVDWAQVRDDATGAALAVPPGWESLDPPAPAVLALAAPHDLLPSGEFRPNVAVTVEVVPSHAQDLRIYSPTVVEGSLATLPDAYVVAVDIYPMLGGQDGRHMVGAYRHGGQVVVLSQYWFMLEGVATAVSASCGLDRFAIFDPVFEGCLRQFEPARGAPRGLR